MYQITDCLLPIYLELACILSIDNYSLHILGVETILKEMKENPNLFLKNKMKINPTYSCKFYEKFFFSLLRVSNEILKS